MREWDRRRFLSTAAIAAGSGLAGWNVFGSRGLLAQAPPAGIPDEILNPVEVSGPEAVAVMGKLPGQKRMYVLPNDAGEYHRIGSQVMKRIARREDTGDVHELATFTGNSGAAMPRHAHLSSHAAVLVMRGEIEFELAGERWTMMRGDFANLPPGTPHGWTMKSDGAQLALFSMNHRVGAAFTAMGERQDGAQVPANAPAQIAESALARAAAAGDFQLAPAATAAGGTGPGDQQAAAGHAGPLRACRRRRRALRRQHVPRSQRQHHRPVPVHHHRRRSGRRSRRAFPRAAFRELLRARRRNAGLGVRQGRAAPHRGLLPGAAAQPARLPAEPGLQPVRRVPDAGSSRASS